MSLGPSIKISSRKSDLARLQAYLVGEALQKVLPELHVDYFFRESLGDVNLNDPLWKMPEKGVFTEDFYLDLVQGKTDAVVHSWKDLPTSPKPDTVIVATLPRADQRDLLLFKKSKMNAVSGKKSLRIFSSSPRREHNLKSFLSQYLPWSGIEVGFEPVRGNIQTRVRKLLENSEVDGLIVAKAALDRLLSAERDEFQETRRFLRQALGDLQWMALPLSVNPNAAAQGALAIEVASHRKDLRELFARINCEKTFSSVQREREVLQSFGGGCHQKIGVAVLKKSFGEIEFLRGESLEGKVLDRLSLQRTHPQNPLKTWKPWYLRKTDQIRRKALEIEWPQDCHAVWVSRAVSDVTLPESYKVLWASGLETWKKLAEQGYWVNGCGESLGEEDPQVDELAGEKLQWARLTHSEADSKAPVKSSFIKKSIEAYSVDLSKVDFEITDQDFFFWKSGSQFLEALQRHPHIRNKYHACGPGRTYETLLETLQDPKRIFIYLNFSSWSQEWNKT